MKFAATLILFSLFCGAGLIAQNNAQKVLDQKIKEFDAYVEKGRVDWQIPGMAVAVVKDGKVIFKKGYGVRELGKADAVDTQTLFACASTTKAMTAAALGMLVDEGKLKWDDAVITHLPEYQLYDPAVTRDLRIRDLLTHNSGVGNTDFLWAMMDIPTREILYRMRLVKPSYPLRASFIYQNVFYIAAGQVIEKVSGKPWEIFVQDRIFTPLAMTRTAAKRKYIKDDNQVRPHMEVDKKIKAIGYTKDDEVGAAGSVWSSIEDMGKWMACMLDSSKFSGGRLLKPATWAELFKPATLVPANEFYPTMKIIKPNWTTYGFGWFQHDYKGKKINYHTGSLDGLTAIHAQLPDQKLGVYVFENLDHAEFRHALVYKTFDLFALGGANDWSKEFLPLYADIKAKNEKQLSDFEAKRVLSTQPSLPLAEYAGKYADPLYGEVEVTVAGGGLNVNLNNVEKATLLHWHYDTFRGPFEKDWNGKLVAQFVLDVNGKVQKINIAGMELTKVK